MGENGYLIVQALVDSEGRFLDVSAGWPCTMSPVNILRQSKLFSGIEESKGYLNGPTFELNDGNSIPQYILGDSCLPLLPWLLTPYIKPVEDVDLSPTQAAFNSVHARAMELVGTAFERVRCRWKLVANKWKGRCDEAFPFVIVACCLLHNFLIKCSENLPDENAEYSRNQEFPVCDEVLDDSGKRVRDVIASHLCLERRVLEPYNGGFPCLQFLKIKGTDSKNRSQGRLLISTYHYLQQLYFFEVFQQKLDPLSLLVSRSLAKFSCILELLRFRALADAAMVPAF
nr:putative nuclease HARBI1 [Ipomoea trifida]